MRLIVQNWWPLLLLVVPGFFWWLRGRSLTDFNRRQLALLISLRSAIVILFILALMAPVLVRRGTWIAVAYLLDVSRSVSPQAIASGVGWVRDTVQQGDSDAARFLAFARNSIGVEKAEELVAVRVADRRSEYAVDRSGTDLADAIHRALESLPPYHLKRIVLVSDGHATEGDVLRALERLRREGARLYAVPSSARSEGDSWIESVTAPDTVTAGEPFALEVKVYNQVAAPTSVVVSVGRETLAAAPIAAKVGPGSVALAPVIAEPGPATLVIELLRDADPVPENDQLEHSLFVRPRPRVLYVEGHAQSAGHLQEALEEGGFVVDVAEPERVPRVTTELDRYAAIVISDVAPDRLTAGQMDALSVYVEQLGGGLVLVGGESIYGESGYAESRLEEILPLWFKAEEEPKELALVIALDKSYSMVGVKMELAKEASKAALDLLTEEQRFGLLAFDYHYYWPVPLQLAVNKQDLRDLIGRIEPSSPTNIFPALEEAYKTLLRTEADIKHIILLSDGKTYEDEYEALVTRMRDAEITVSTVAVGNKADRQLLGNIASWGGGRNYFIEDPQRVPQIFVEETQLAAGSTLAEDEPASAAVRKAVEALKGIDFEDAPALFGYNRMLPKDSAEVVLETSADDVLLARWQYGLGRTAVFTSDVKSRWAVDWLGWDGYRKFWTQLVREIARRDEFREPDLSVERVGSRARVTLETLRNDGTFDDGLRPPVEVRLAGGDTQIVEARQVAPGSYSLSVNLPEDGIAAFRWLADYEVQPERHLTTPFPAEYRFHPPDVDQLRRYSEVTGGVFGPTLEQLFDPGEDTVLRPLRLWPGLVGLALILYLANMLLRRIRVFEER